jgi:hypothetical protein
MGERLLRLSQQYMRRAAAASGFSASAVAAWGVKKHQQLLFHRLAMRFKRGLGERLLCLPSESMRFFAVGLASANAEAAEQQSAAAEKQQSATAEQQSRTAGVKRQSELGGGVDYGHRRHHNHRY